MTMIRHVFRTGDGVTHAGLSHFDMRGSSYRVLHTDVTVTPHGDIVFSHLVEVQP